MEIRKNSNEHAANIAASKWCELLFSYHLQDNGATDDASFLACMLSTISGERAKEKISDESKQKARYNLEQYYLHYLKHIEVHSKFSESEWIRENYSDLIGNNGWFGFDDDLYCDYHPCRMLKLILMKSGIHEDLIEFIAPIKTGIEIDPVKNSVIYKTYGHREIIEDVVK